MITCGCTQIDKDLVTENIEMPLSIMKRKVNETLFEKVDVKVKLRKIVLMGSYMVGKSMLASTFLQRNSKFDYNPTLEHTWDKQVFVHGQAYHVKIIDTAGQEYLFPTQYATYSDGFCFVYRVSSQRSFQVVRKLYEKLADLVQPIEVPIILIGNKDYHDRQVLYSEGVQLAREMKAQFYEVNVIKDSLQITEAFERFLLTIDGHQAPKPSRKPRSAWHSILEQIGHSLVPT